LGLPLVYANREAFDASAALKKSTEVLLSEGTAPKISGLFDTQSSPPDAILLSHAHLDHMGLIHRTRPEIPVIATAGTSKMMLAGALFAGREGLSRDRHKPICAGEDFQVGDLQITPFAVDHSTFGSMAFLIESNGKRILYTGDLRNHGRKPGMMRTLLDSLREKPLDLLITEGTHLGGDSDPTQNEFDLEEKIFGYIRGAKSLVFCCFSPQDVDRLVTIYRASVRSGRTFVVDGYTAFVLHLVQKEASIPPPKKEYGMRVFFNQGFARKKNRKLESLFEADRIELNEILAEPLKYVMAFRRNAPKTKSHPLWILERISAEPRLD
jgi:ribonuclease J